MWIHSHGLVDHICLIIDCRFNILICTSSLFFLAHSVFIIRLSTLHFTFVLIATKHTTQRKNVSTTSGQKHKDLLTMNNQLIECLVVVTSFSSFIIPHCWRASKRFCVEEYVNSCICVAWPAFKWRTIRTVLRKPKHWWSFNEFYHL